MINVLFLFFGGFSLRLKFCAYSHCQRPHGGLASSTGDAGDIEIPWTSAITRPRCRSVRLTLPAWCSCPSDSPPSLPPAAGTSAAALSTPSLPAHLHLNAGVLSVTGSIYLLPPFHSQLTCFVTEAAFYCWSWNPVTWAGKGRLPG